MEENWRPVPMAVGIYSVSDQGRVRRERPACGTSRGFIHSPPHDKDGYLYLSLHVGGRRIRYRVHRLVMEAFVGPAPEGMQVNHLNGRKTDNRLVNLEYVTSAENTAHAGRLGLMPSGARHGSRTHPELLLRGEQKPNAKLTAKEVLEIRALSPGLPLHVIADRFRVSRISVWKIVKHRAWAHVAAEELS
jgi:hypothetical protein